MTRLGRVGVGRLAHRRSTISIACMKPSPRTSPIAAYLAARQRAAGRRQRLAELAAALQQTILLEGIEYSQRCGAGERVAAIGAAQPARRRRVHDLGPADHAGQRQAAGEALGDRHAGPAAMPDCWKANILPVRPKPVWISSMISTMP